MITYLDTSVVVKLVLGEQGSDAAGRIWLDADDRVASQLIIVEARAALASAARRGRVSPEGLRAAQGELERLLDGVDLVEVDLPLVELAAEVAEHHGLRGYDAVHLASAILVGSEVLASSDADLCRAGGEAGLHVANPLAA